MSHTPGPWCVDAAPSNRLRIATTMLVDHEISADEWGGTIDKVKEAQANARLIAAAPQMLSVIERLNVLLDVPDLEKNEARWDDAMAEVEAELIRVAAKARGEESHET